MSEKSCIFQGSFDPITKGHIEIIRQAAEIFDTVYVVVMENIRKKYMFRKEQRLEMVASSTKKFKNVKAELWDGPLADYAKKKGCFNIVRGIRNSADFEYEKNISFYNNKLCDKINTLYVYCGNEFEMISSSGIRELITFGADISEFVPKEVLNTVYGGNNK